MRISKVSTSHLEKKLKEHEMSLVDIRPIAAYNGWRLRGELRGGHIPGAKSIPLQWTQYMDWVEVLEEKQVNKNKPIILYGYDSDETGQMAAQLGKLGFEQVTIYNHFVDEWVKDEARPLEQLKRYKHLVYPEWLMQLLNGQNPPEYDNEHFVICHSHYDHIEDYQKGHIPGAIALDTNSLETTETWNRRTPKELEATLTSLGITNDTTVIVYGRFSAPVFNEEKFPGKSAGHLGAIRCAALMLYAGVKDVRILNGGIGVWERAGYEIETKTNKPQPVNSFGTVIPGRPHLMIDTPQAKEYIANEGAELVSIRSWEEFIGKSSGYHYIEKKGRIPGAVFGNCGSDAYHMENYRNFDNTFREYPEIAKKWREAGITPDKKIAFYCGTGWRGSEA
ncbi:MAG: rhodanese-like domain-containing protein, partial [Balneolaceae bacterium]